MSVEWSLPNTMNQSPAIPTVLECALIYRDTDLLIVMGLINLYQGHTNLFLCFTDKDTLY